MTAAGDVGGVVEAVELLKGELASIAGVGPIRDVAFIGSASDAYVWVPSRITDFDAFVFVDEIDAAAGAVLDALRERVAAAMDELGVDFEVRIIKGSYKPDRRDGERPVVFAHLGVFDVGRYLSHSVAVRWTWRKYPCVVEPARLARLASGPPSADDLINGPSGIAEKLAALAAGMTTMEEFVLPDLHREVRVFEVSSPVFAAFCHGAVATTARHHARVLGRPEADSLGNDEFFEWYDSNVLRTSCLLPVIELKMRSRNEGFTEIDRCRLLAVEFLEAVRNKLTNATPP